MKKYNHPWFSRFIILQLSIAIIITLGFWIAQDKFYGLSSALGSMISIVPGLVFVPLFFNQGHTQNARAILSGFYLAEGLKLFISLVLFTLVFQWSKLKVLPLFVSFIAMQITYWLIPFLTRRN